MSSQAVDRAGVMRDPGCRSATSRAGIQVEGRRWTPLRLGFRLLVHTDQSRPRSRRCRPAFPIAAAIWLLCNAA
jgi:hypothetical protein